MPKAADSPRQRKLLNIFRMQIPRDNRGFRILENYVLENLRRDSRPRLSSRAQLDSVSNWNSAPFYFVEYFLPGSAAIMESQQQAAFGGCCQWVLDTVCQTVEWLFSH